MRNDESPLETLVQNEVELRMAMEDCQRLCKNKDWRPLRHKTDVGSQKEVMMELAKTLKQNLV